MKFCQLTKIMKRRGKPPPGSGGRAWGGGLHLPGLINTWNDSPPRAFQRAPWRSSAGSKLGVRVYLESWLRSQKLQAQTPLTPGGSSDLISLSPFQIHWCRRGLEPSSQPLDFHFLLELQLPPPCPGTPTPTLGAGKALATGSKPVALWSWITQNLSLSILDCKMGAVRPSKKKSLQWLHRIINEKRDDQHPTRSRRLSPR